MTTPLRGSSQSNLDGQGEDSHVLEKVCAADGNNGRDSGGEPEPRVSASQVYDRLLNPPENKREAENTTEVDEEGSETIAWLATIEEEEDKDIPTTDAPDELPMSSDDEMEVDPPASEVSNMEFDGGSDDEVDRFGGSGFLEKIMESRPLYYLKRDSDTGELVKCYDDADWVQTC
ncbi:hypothetical protein B0H67DRAFT_644189 [Lasiosphaeris hirsuta]|uniref:Uncharacterized protein n=1 Tax=Lasiosphaeris hirsuta TaxID=260670 RepID=A0AA40AS36_9PEZI|nr:hypothetical protein B0H67DRAFT_644189 [Lasiosphaeris hirsuta]